MSLDRNSPDASRYEWVTTQDKGKSRTKDSVSPEHFRADARKISVVSPERNKTKTRHQEYDPERNLLKRDQSSSLDGSESRTKCDYSHSPKKTRSRKESCSPEESKPRRNHSSSLERSRSRSKRKDSRSPDRHDKKQKHKVPSTSPERSKSRKKKDRSFSDERSRNRSPSSGSSRSRSNSRRRSVSKDSYRDSKKTKKSGRSHSPECDKEKFTPERTRSKTKKKLSPESPGYSPEQTTRRKSIRGVSREKDKKEKHRPVEKGRDRIDDERKEKKVEEHQKRSERSDNIVRGIR